MSAPVFRPPSSAVRAGCDDPRGEVGEPLEAYERRDDPFGQIVPADYAPGRTLMVGQALGADGDPRPLTGLMGVRLAELAGLGDDEYAPGSPPLAVPMELRIGLYVDRVNLLARYPGREAGQKGHRFPMTEARRSAVALAPLLGEYKEIVFCGRAVCDAFAPLVRDGQAPAWRRQPPLRPQRWTTFAPNPTALLSWVPHTSGVVIWWNDPGNAADAERHLRGVVDRVCEELLEIADWDCLPGRRA